MKKLLLFFLSFTIGLILFFWVLDYTSLDELLSAFSIFWGWQGLAILISTFLIALIGVWKWKEILKDKNVDLPLKSLVGPYLSGYSIMLLAPVVVLGGELFRGYFLREKYSLPWGKSLASVIIDRISEVAVNLLIIFLGIFIFLWHFGVSSMNLIYLLAVSAVFFLLFLAFFYSKSSRNESIVKIFLRNGDKHPLETEQEIFNFFKLANGGMWKVMLISFLRAAMMYLRVWLLLLFLGKQLGALAVLSILGFSYLATMIPIPVALGSHEAVQAFAFSAFGLSASSAAAFAIVIRSAEIVIILFGLIALFRLGFFLLKNSILKKIEN